MLARVSLRSPPAGLYNRYEAGQAEDAGLTYCRHECVQYVLHARGHAREAHDEYNMLGVVTRANAQCSRGSLHLACLGRLINIGT